MRPLITSHHYKWNLSMLRPWMYTFMTFWWPVLTLECYFTMGIFVDRMERLQLCIDWQLYNVFKTRQIDHSSIVCTRLSWYIWTFSMTVATDFSDLVRPHRKIQLKARQGLPVNKMKNVANNSSTIQQRCNNNSHVYQMQLAWPGLGQDKLSTPNHVPNHPGQGVKG